MDNFDKMTRLEVLTIKLRALKKEHRELDIKISSLVDLYSSDQFSLRLLKKNKLSLKDKITRLEDEITPDIIA
ncbi:MAG: hypothetical protein CML41_07070 [Rhodobacteraceae bacterium]|nr:hypothetical protein [Paracoccaceae bacterium]MBL6855721.1 DUF465 domain-containing protein [Paracoccaceae bacterium]|tara:strand:+ start:13005 stop:13223 length:219 start_codon:yes stop_codon:yes gene_type:complete